jgi:PLP dependent protein
MPLTNDIPNNLEAVLARIQTAARNSGRNPDEITLVAVSKTKPLQSIQAAFEAGQLHFGENKVQELVPKMEQGPQGAVWHMIGTLQSNKVKYMSDRVDWIHSVPKLSTLLEVDKRAGAANRIINVLIQVNISDEDQKSGCDPQDLPAILGAASGLKHTVVRGLMGIASLELEPEQVRPQFRMLRELRDKYRTLYGGAVQLEHLSMGMTLDLEVAIEEGATMVRVGSAIFGERSA